MVKQKIDLTTSKLLGFLLQKIKINLNFLGALHLEIHIDPFARITELESEVQGIKISDSAIAHSIYEKPNLDSPTKSDIDFYI